MDQLLALFTNNPWFVLVQTIGLLISAGMNIYYMRSTKQDEVDERVSKAQSQLNNALDKRVELLEKEMKEAQEKLQEANSKLDQVLNENRRLETILAMRDPASEEYRLGGLRAMHLIDEIHEVVTTPKRGRKQVGS